MKKQHIDFSIYLSTIMLVAGVFLPLTKLPFYGNVSYHRIAEIESYLIIIFAVTAPILLFTKKTHLLKFAPAGVLATLLFPMIIDLFKSTDEGFFGQIGASASSAMQNFAADFFMNIADFHWGGFVFLAGLLIFTIGCILRSLQSP